MKTSDIFVENLVNKKLLLAAFYHLTYQHDSKDYNICNYETKVIGLAATTATPATPSAATPTCWRAPSPCSCRAKRPPPGRCGGTPGGGVTTSGGKRSGKSVSGKRFATGPNNILARTLGVKQCNWVSNNVIVTSNNVIGCQTI